MSEFVPQEINGWRAQGEVKTYDRETIFEYIDGAGEVYRLYAFRELKVHRFTKANEPDIVVEVFNMGNSKDAFGVFTHGREGEEAGIGQGSEYRGGLLCFWKNKYFVCIFAEGESEAAQQAVLDLGRAIADGIKIMGSKPKIIDSLPRQGLISNSLRFFHTHVSLNYHYFLADSNILDLDENTDAVLARYEESEGKPLLLLVQYGNEGSAQVAFDSFIEAYLPEASETNVLQTEDGTWIAAKVMENVVSIVFDAPTEEKAIGLLHELK